jgi:CBS domain-containing membrane protein
MFTVAEIMTREPYSLGPDDSLATARKIMAEHHIRHIPVVSDDGSLIGLVSQRDVLAAEDSTVLNEEGGPGSRDQYVAISAIMTAPVQTVEESAGLRGTAMHMQKNKLGCLPVLNEGQLAGIITDSDFVAIAINLLEQLESTEPGENEFDDQ